MRRKVILPVIGDFHLLCLSLAVGATLRFYHLGTQPIWGDEALTLQVYAVGAHARDVLANVWAKAFHPPLYFLIVHYVTALGASETTLRLPSAVLGIATIPIVYLITRRLFRVGAAGIAAVVVALSPFHLYYSQEARMYSLQVFLCAASTVFFLKAWKSRHPLDYLLYAVATVSCLYTHIGTLLLVASQGAFVIGSAFRDRARLVTWLLVFAVVLTAFTPWVMNFVSAHRRAAGDSPIGFDRGGGLLQPAYALYTFSVGYSLGPSVSRLHTASAREAVSDHLAAILLTAIVYGSLLVAGLLRAFRGNRYAFWFLLVSLALPFVLVITAATLPGLALNARYLMVAIVPFWICLALGVQASLRLRATRLLPAAAVLIAAVSICDYYALPAYAKQDVRSAADFVNRAARPGDIVIISSVEMGGPFIYYYTRFRVPYVGYPPGRGYVDEKVLPTDLAHLIVGKQRAWLVLGRTWSSDPRDLIARFFHERFAQVEDRRYDGVRTLCFDLSRSHAPRAIMRNHACYSSTHKDEKTVD